MASEARLKANRANAKKSTGPKSDAGKARSAQNALKHGLCAESVIIPGENPDDLYKKRLEWESSMHPRNSAEREAIKLAVDSSHRRDRCRRAEDARIAKAARESQRAYDLEQTQKAYALGKQLLDDPVNRAQPPPADKDDRRELKDFNAVEPALIVAELCTFAAGAAFLIERLNALLGLLTRDAFWTAPDMYAALRLLGMRPDDALADVFVARVFKSCQALHPEPSPFGTMASRACLGREGRAADPQRVGPLDEDLGCNRRQAFKFLSETVLGEIRRLRVLKVTNLDPDDRLDRAEAPLRALFDDSKEAALQVRYERERGLELNRALTQLVALKKLDTEAEPLPPIEPPPAVVNREPVASSAQESAPRNEPNPKPKGRASHALKEAIRPCHVGPVPQVEPEGGWLRAALGDAWEDIPDPDPNACGPKYGPDGEFLYNKPYEPTPWVPTHWPTDGIGR